jgi:hypothetical protein
VSVLPSAEIVDVLLRVDITALPISATSGRYEYFLFQYLRSKNIGVFVLRTPDPSTDLWDHVPPHNKTSPYNYSCSKIKSGYPFCYDACDMCTKPRSTSLIEAAIDKAGTRAIFLFDMVVLPTVLPT